MNSGAPGAAASEPLAVEPPAAVGPSRIHYHEGHGNTTKQLLNSPDAGLWIFAVSKASGRSLFDHSFRPYIYAG